MSQLAACTRHVHANERDANEAVCGSRGVLLFRGRDGVEIASQRCLVARVPAITGRSFPPRDSRGIQVGCQGGTRSGCGWIPARVAADDIRSGYGWILAHVPAADTRWGCGSTPVRGQVHSPSRENGHHPQSARPLRNDLPWQTSRERRVGRHLRRQAQKSACSCVWDLCQRHRMARSSEGAHAHEARQLDSSLSRFPREALPPPNGPRQRGSHPKAQGANVAICWFYCGGRGFSFHVAAVRAVPKQQRGAAHLFAKVSGSRLSRPSAPRVKRLLTIRPACSSDRETGSEALNVGCETFPSTG